MPSRVHTSRDSRVGLEIDFLYLIGSYEQCSTLVLTGMELHIVGLIVLVGVAIDTLPVLTCAQ